MTTPATPIPAIPAPVVPAKPAAPVVPPTPLVPSFAQLAALVTRYNQLLSEQKHHQARISDGDSSRAKLPTVAAQIAALESQILSVSKGIPVAAEK